MFYSFLVSDVIYTSRAYATMSVSICLWRKCTVVTVDAGKRRGDAIATARPSCTCEMIISLKHLPYMERLKQLKLPTLKYRRLRGDMIEVYKSLAVASIARDVESSSTNRSSDIMPFTKIKKCQTSTMLFWIAAVLVWLPYYRSHCIIYHQTKMKPLCFTTSNYSRLSRRQIRTKKGF